MFRQDLKLTDVLQSQKFTLSAEVIPPRNGTEQQHIFHQIDALVTAGTQFFAVTKGAGGSLRGGSLPIAQAIKDRFGVPCIAHFTCRDLTPQEVENQLVDHYYFGIRNILALRGDPPDGQLDWKPRDGGYNYAYQLIEQVQRLNEGLYLSRVGGPTVQAPIKTDFCIGAAAYPDFPDEKNRIEYFALKVKAGAKFGITDMLFDPDSYGRFLDQCDKAGVLVPLLPGTRLLKSKPQALRMAQKFKAVIPEATLAKLPEKEGPENQQIALDLLMQLAEKLKTLGAPGIHLYVIADTLGATTALQALKKRFG